MTFRPHGLPGRRWRLFAAAAFAALAVGCGGPDGGGQGVDSGTPAMPQAEAEKDVSCKEFVIATAANACLNNIRSNFGEGPVGGDGPAMRGECGLASMVGGPTGDAIDYAQTDDLALTHSRDEPIDWDAVEARCEVGARMAVNDLCDQLNSSYNCAAGE